jgi:hypothetical protein
MDWGQLALLIGLANGLILLVKPIPRVHSRLDVLESRLEYLEQMLARLDARQRD